jgi:hypothetical protein
MRHLVKMKGGAEHDCFSSWKHWLCYMHRPGVKKSIKRGYKRRERKALKSLIKLELEGVE